METRPAIRVKMTSVRITLVKILSKSVIPSMKKDPSNYVLPKNSKKVPRFCEGWVLG